MRSFSILSGLVSLTVFLSFTDVVLSAPSKRHIAEDLHSKRQTTQGPYPIVGVQTGAVLPRYELRDLYQNFPDQWNVYILGLDRLHNQDQSVFLSHFSIAGIHGLPKQSWNNIAGNPASVNPGYCTHASNLFLPWHRPYLALYEVSFRKKPGGHV
jgi:tyrosinase